jgi:hypothetical protein
MAWVALDQGARALFVRLLGICNDVGLLSEEYDPSSGRLIGNFPQALSHLSLGEHRAQPFLRSRSGAQPFGRRGGLSRQRRYAC